MGAYKDLDKKRAANKRGIEKIYLTSTTVRFRKDDQNFYDRLVAECEKQQITIAEFLRQAARKELYRIAHQKKTPEQ